MQKKVLLAGGSGLIGQRIQQLLRAEGYQPAILTRGKSQPDKGRYHWDPAQNSIDPEALNQCYGVINLAGTNIGQWPWTAARKKSILDSRLESTTFLLEQVRSQTNPPQVYINASATGYYPDAGDEWLIEDHAPDVDFLGRTCTQWENAVHRQQPLPFRTCLVRIGLVMSNQGGMYPKMRLGTQFKLGVTFGKGSMYFSWIHIDDLARMFVFLLGNVQSQGIFNGVAPHPLPMKKWMQQLTSFRNSWLTLPVPAWLLKLILGEFAQLLLKGGRVSADKILQEGFDFKWPEWPAALRDIEKRNV